jgi:hypothetical protein
MHPARGMLLDDKNAAFGWTFDGRGTAKGFWSTLGTPLATISIEWHETFFGGFSVVP